MIKEKHKTAGNFTYNPNDILGSGMWGTVFKAKKINATDDNLYALKKINKFKIEASESSFEKYKSEVITLQKGNTIPEIIKFVDCFKSKSSYYIVTEYLPGSTDLFSYIEENKGKFS